MVGIRSRMLVLMVVMVASACGDATEPAAEDDAGGRESVAINAADFAFDPTSIPAAAGAELTVDVTNSDDVEHSFTAEAVDVDLVVAPGDSGSVDLTVPDGGLEFVCRFHPSMTGTIGDVQAGDGMGGGGTRDDMDY